nr:ribokinase [Clostridioides sp.]
MGNIIVVGSANLDMVCSVDKRPKSGETVLGNDFFTSPGGKGANQAVAAAKLEGNVDIVACLGYDSFGDQMLENFNNNNVNTSLITKKEGVSSGVASIVLSDNDNSIIVVQGANELLDVGVVKQFEKELLKADIVLLQLEIPLKTVEYVVDFCYENKIKVLLNPAPAVKLSTQIVEKVSYLTPNEHEYKIVFNTKESVESILEKHPNKLIITEGSNGVRFHDGEQVRHVPSIKVEVQDTTGAGDTFNGALSVGITEGKTLYDSVKYAVVASGLSVTKLGAQPGMPSKEEVYKYLQANQK